MFLAFIIAASLLISTAVENSGTSSLPKPAGCDFLGRDNATKIIGREVSWTGTDGTTPDGVDIFKCTFVEAENSEGGAKLHFMLMKSPTPEGAKKEFETVRQLNQNHAGFEEWPGVSDEAIVHSDGKSFHFVMVRTGSRTIRLKVNPVKAVELEAVKSVALSLSSRLQKGGKGDD